MRHNVLVMALPAVAALLAVGCTPTDGTSTAQPDRAGVTTTKLENVKTETKEAGRAIEDYAYAQKAELVDKMSEDLAGMKAELDRLSAKVEASTGEAKAEAEVALATAREKWSEAKTQLDRAANATEDTWDDVKDGAKRSYGELESSVERSRQWLSDKLEP